jgi:hypothetical protein
MAQTNQHLSELKYLGARSGPVHGIAVPCGQWRTPPPCSLMRLR